MGSDSKKPPKPRHKFSFSGQTKLPEIVAAPRSSGVTRDDILNSLTKHAHPQESSEEFPDVGYASPQDSNERVVPARTRSRGSARGAFLIFLGGFLAVWLYGYVTHAYDIPYLRGVIESPEVQTASQLVTSNPILFGAFSGSFLFGALGALYLRHRKKN